MSISYVYIDESGDLGPFGSKYFTVVALTTKNPINLSRIIKRLRQKKLKKTIKQLSEIKANNSDRRVREYILKSVGKTDSDISVVVVEKNKILQHLFNTKNKLYNYFCGLLIKRLDLNCKKLFIVIDKKHTNSLLQEDFNQYIERKLKEKYDDISVNIVHEDSYKSNELQVVDFIVWSIQRKFNAQDDYYYKLIEGRITNKNNMLVWE